MKNDSIEELDLREKERWDEPSCYVVTGSVVNASVVMKNESVEMLEPCEMERIVVDHNTLEQEEKERLISEDEKVSVSDVFWKGKEKIHQPKNGRSPKLVLKRYIDMCLDSGELSASVVTVVSGSDVSGFAVVMSVAL
ncbi:hypothetical protein Tco_0559017 [Tanacetum coccineum]